MELARMDPPGVELPKSCLLAIKPVVADSTNATTATYQTEHPDDSRAISIQVSLFVHPFQMEDSQHCSTAPSLAISYKCCSFRCKGRPGMARNAP
nr:uncharacterized protein LOC109787050 [Aegilops tauschii subsp. strangulata]